MPDVFGYKSNSSPASRDPVLLCLVEARNYGIRKLGGSVDFSTLALAVANAALGSGDLVAASMFEISRGNGTSAQELLDQAIARLKKTPG